jgi:hypothetical protein
MVVVCVQRETVTEDADIDHGAAWEGHYSCGLRRLGEKVATVAGVVKEKETERASTCVKLKTSWSKLET